MNKKIISNEIILEATIDYVARNSLENVTMKKIAKELGLSEGTIYNYFPNKKVLLGDCLRYIDIKIDNELRFNVADAFNFKKAVKQMWKKYYTYLLEHSNYAKFYRQYRQSAYYNQSEIEKQDQSYAWFTKFIKKYISVLGVNPDMFWVFLIETTLNFAIRVADNELPNDEEMIYRIISHGYIGAFKKQKEE